MHAVVHLCSGLAGRAAAEASGNSSAGLPKRRIGMGPGNGPCAGSSRRIHNSVGHLHAGLPKDD
jgi:hypothetical protein